MKEDNRKYHYETQTVHKNETSYFVGLGQLLLFAIMLVCGLYTAANPQHVTSFWTSPYWFFPLAGINIFGAFVNLEGNMGEEKKVRVYHKPKPKLDASKENVSDEDARNDILGG